MALRMAGREIEARRVYTEIDRAPGANLVGTYTMIELAGALPVPPKWMPEYATRLAEAGINASAFELPAGSD
jgi:hypothetical protein